MSYVPLPHAPGGTYFFTLRVQGPHANLLVAQVDVLRQAVKVTRQRHPFEIRAAVVLPSQLHMIWTLPTGDANFGFRWRTIKSIFSRHALVTQQSDLSPAMLRRREKGIWQRRFWDHQIRDQADFDLHEHLIIHAPVTAGLVKKPGDWAYSSLHTRGIGKTKLGIPPPFDLQKPPALESTLF